MNLYLIWQDINEDINTYDSAVVCAEDEEDAKMIHPNCNVKDWDGEANPWDEWCKAKYVEAKFIGTAAEGIKHGVVCTSFKSCC